MVGRFSRLALIGRIGRGFGGYVAQLGCDRIATAPRHLQILMGLTLVLAGAQPTLAMAKSANSRGSTAPSADEVARKQMIFFVAKGAPNSCGPGCNEWIAAEGMIDRDVGQRLRGLLEALPNRKLPIFFNSPGGDVSGSFALGRILRAHGLVAGVGQTMPEGCRGSSPSADACRRLMRSKPEHAARLVTAGARCLSGCAFALLGGSVRQVARGAQLGVHEARAAAAVKGVPASRTFSKDEVNGAFKRYTAEMGGDLGLVDLAVKTSSDRMHYLSREELTRFGFNVGNSYETSWTWYEDFVKRPYVTKSVQMKETVEGDYRTRGIRLWCVGAGSGAWFDYDRELLPREADAPDLIRVAAGQAEMELMASPGQRGLERISRRDATRRASSRRSEVASREFLNQAMAAREIVITEVFYANPGPESSRVVRLSTDGLAQSLTALQKDCGWTATTATSAAASAATASTDASVKAKGRAEEHLPK